MMLRDSRGVTLTELLVTIVIASIMMFAFAIPFVAERIFWNQGKQQAEAQRDAQLVLHAITREARACDSAVVVPGTGQTRVTLTGPCGNIIFEGGPNFNAGKLQETKNGGAPYFLIDGVRSRVQEFTATYDAATRILYLRIQIDHKNRGTEILETRVLLRNKP